MTLDESILREIDRSYTSRVGIGNDQLIQAKDKCEVLISTSGTKAISDVILVHEIDQNLLSISQLLEKNYAVIFKGRDCIIFDPIG